MRFAVTDADGHATAPVISKSNQMKIHIQEEKKALIILSKIPPGDVFKHRAGFYIKSKVSNSHVCLSIGEFIRLDSNTEVEHCSKAILHPNN